MNLDTEDTIEGTDLQYGAIDITFTAQQLEENHRYNVRVTAFNVIGKHVSVVPISK